MENYQRRRSRCFSGLRKAYGKYPGEICNPVRKDGMIFKNIEAVEQF